MAQASVRRFASPATAVFLLFQLSTVASSRVTSHLAVSLRVHRNSGPVPQSQISTLRRLLCPLSVQTTACPCVRLLSRMSAVAALLASPTLPASAPTTPKNNPPPPPRTHSPHPSPPPSPA